MPEDSPFPYGGGLTGYSDEESEDDKNSENDDEIALQWRLTGYSESEKKMTTSDDESADAKMTSDESSETMIEMKYMAI